MLGRESKGLEEVKDQNGIVIQSSTPASYGE